MEAAIKMIGTGLIYYFKVSQNIFDFFLVVTSILGLFENLVPINLTAMRAVRATRILRVFKSLRSIQVIL